MKYQDLTQKINKPYFSTLDLLINKITVYNYQLSLWLKKGYLGKLKRGYYFFTNRQAEITTDEISFLIYEPSYISMESALSYYGLIPEMVYAKTAVTTKITRNFNNSFGAFIYRSIKPPLFFGYKTIQTKFGKYLLAEPEKALLDYFYFNLGKINNQDDLEELRINCELAKKLIDKNKINNYLKIYKIKKMESMIDLFFDTIC